nr:ribonuclease H-like domain-containing protein [Tanacetum cinerariifolium]
MSSCYGKDVAEILSLEFARRLGLYQVAELEEEGFNAYFEGGIPYTIGSILNTPDRLFSTFDGVYHQTFRAVRFDVVRTTESDSDDEQYVIKRNRPQEHIKEKPDCRDPNAQSNKKQWKRCCFHKLTMSSCYGKDVAEILSLDDMLRIKVHEARSDEEIFTFVAWIRAFNINEAIYAELCHEIYCIMSLMKLGLYQVAELDEEGFSAYFEGEMDLESTQNNVVAKLPLLKQVPRTTANANGTSTSTIPGPVTTEEKAQKKNDVKARSMLLMTLPNEHLLTFSQYKDAKTLFEAMQARFGGNDATKKAQRTLLKQMYENFNAPSTESFDSIFNCTNEVDTTSIQVSDVNTPVSTVRSPDNTANLSDATMYAFLENQINGSQLVHEDLEQIHEDDLEEMDLKWQLALLSMRVTRSPKNHESRPMNQDSSRKTVIVEDTSSKAMVVIDGAGFDWSYMANDEVPTNMALMDFSDSERSSFCKEQLVFYKKNEVVFCDQIAILKRDALYRDSKITSLNLQIEKLKKEKERNQIKIDNFENASKSLDKLIRSQITDNNKTGLGFTSYNDVAPPPTGLFLPPSIDLSNSGLEENFAPTAVLTKSGIVPITTSRQSSSTAAALVSTARPINTAASKPLVNVVKPRQNALQTTHSLSRIPFYQPTALKNRNLNNNVNVAKANSVNTDKGNKVTSAIGNQGINVVKSSACWVCRPKIKVQDHVSKNSRSYICEAIQSLFKSQLENSIFQPLFMLHMDLFGPTS